MKLFKRKNPNEIIVPTGWHQLSIGQYEEILQHIKHAKKLKENDEYNEVVLKCKVIAASVSMQRSDISKQPLALINIQFETIMNFLTQLPKMVFVNEFNMCGTTYVVNPDMRLNADQFIKREEIVKAGGQRMFADITALYVWPMGSEFKISEYKKIAELLYHHCPCSVLLPLSDFFLQLGIESRPVIEDYLKKKNLNLLREVHQDMMETIKEESQLQTPG